MLMLIDGMIIKSFHELHLDVRGDNIGRNITYWGDSLPHGGYEMLNMSVQASLVTYSKDETFISSGLFDTTKHNIVMSTGHGVITGEGYKHGTNREVFGMVKTTEMYNLTDVESIEKK